MKRWQISAKLDKDQDIVDLILQNRGITSPADKEVFLNPPKPILAASGFIPEFKKSLLNAKKIINEQMAQNKPIVVHGDYDADGICATAILYGCLKNELGYAKTYAFIPNRFDHGYGLSVKSADHILGELAQVYGKNPEDVLIITVDSGITSLEAVDHINSLGHKVIISDHHQKPGVLPKALEIVWEDQVVGAGIAWYLSKTLGSKDPQTVAFAALATVTDLQPLLGINRSLVKYGLEVLNSNPPIGIKKLLDVSGRRSSEVTTYDLGWVVGPRLNASGRLVEATEGLSLLLEKDESMAFEYAQKLNSINTDRQDKTIEMYEMAGGLDEGEVPPVIFSSNNDYHEGIIGLVAARLMQTYYRPAVVISLNDGVGKGSARSIPGINIIEVLRKFEDLFDNVGGHPMAAGFTIPIENISILEKKMSEYISENIPEEIFTPVIEIDMEIPLDEVNLDLATKLESLQPYGISNKEPVFMSKHIGVVSVDWVGKEANHLSLRLYSGNAYFKGIMFSAPDTMKSVMSGDYVDLVFKIKLNEFNGNSKVDLIIEDLKKV